MPITKTTESAKPQKPAETDTLKVPQKRYTIDGLRKAQQQAQAATAVINPPSLYDRIVVSPQLSNADAHLVNEAAHYSYRTIGSNPELSGRWLALEKYIMDHIDRESGEFKDPSPGGLQGLLNAFENAAPMHAEKMAARTRYLLNNYRQTLGKPSTSPAPDSK